MSNLLDIESLLKQGNNPINVFTEKLINLSLPNYKFKNLHYD